MHQRRFSRHSQSRLPWFLLPQPFPLVSSSRWMVKRGELTAFVEDSGIFLKRTSRQQVYFFLFNDVLIVTKKKR